MSLQNYQFHLWQTIKMMITAILVKKRMTVTVTVKMKNQAAAVIKSLARAVKRNPLVAAVVKIRMLKSGSVRFFTFFGEPRHNPEPCSKPRFRSGLGPVQV